MESPRRWFNIYFFATLAVLACGCHSQGFHYGHKQVATIRLYLETRDQDVAAGNVLVTRQRIPMSIDRDPFLDEAELRSAQLIDEPDGTFAIDLVFNDHGSALLETTTIGSRGRHIIVFSHFPTPGTRQASETSATSDATQAPPDQPGKPRQSGWISVVKINGRISNGHLVFTPDTTRAEAETIVAGLNTVIKKIKK